MSPEEQLAWVTDFEALMSGGGDRIVTMARQRQPQWQADDAATVRRIVQALAAWPFAADFCDKAQRYGDYMARTGRLPVYVDKVKERLADGLTMTDQQGRVVAYVSPSTPMRRRGRPTKEEVAARLRGESLAALGQTPDDAEARKRRLIARMMGLEVVVSGDAPREKNNAELAAERAARRAAYDRQNPSLFGSDTGGTVPAAAKGKADSTEGLSPSVSPALQSGTTAASHTGDSPSVTSADAGTSQQGQSPSAPLVCPTMSEIYNDRIANDRLRLADLAWLCSDGLRQRIPTVQALRVTAESASERAKTMADLGQPAKDIEPYAQQAKEATEAYLAIYAAVDEELAVLHKRLYLDTIYLENFKRRFKGVDIEKVLHITRPYYEKVRKDDPAIDARVKLAIETDNPEYAAKLKAEEEKKQEIADILRYLKRKDKMATDVRLKSAKEVKFPRLVELIGEEEAKNYYPLITYIEEENAKLHAAESAAATTPDASASGASPSKKKTPKKR